MLQSLSFSRRRVVILFKLPSIVALYPRHIHHCDMRKLEVRLTLCPRAETPDSSRVIMPGDESIDREIGPLAMDHAELDSEATTAKSQKSKTKTKTGGKRATPKKKAKATVSEIPSSSPPA